MLYKNFSSALLVKQSVSPEPDIGNENYSEVVLG